MVKPVIIYSHIDFSSRKIKSSFSHEMAKVSNILAQKQNFHTVLYTSKKDRESFKNIKYSEVIEFDDNLLKDIPKSLWNMGKILAMSIEKRPFLHIDLDMFIFNKKFLEKIKDKEFVSFHEEPWLFSTPVNNTSSFYDKAVYSYKSLNFEKIFNLNSDLLDTSNFAIAGSCLEKAIPIINQESEFIFQKVIEHKDVFDKVCLEKNNNFIYGHQFTMLVEQWILYSRLKTKLNCYHLYNNKETTMQKLTDIYLNSLPDGLFHLWFMKKKHCVSTILTGNAKHYKTVQQLFKTYSDYIKIIDEII